MLLKVGKADNLHTAMGTGTRLHLLPMSSCNCVPVQGGAAVSHLVVMMMDVMMVVMMMMDVRMVVMMVMDVMMVVMVLRCLTTLSLLGNCRLHGRHS